MRAWRLMRIAVALVVTACASDPSPSGPGNAGSGDVPDDGSSTPPAAGAIVSAAVPRSLLPVGMAGSGSLVFVSAAPGSFPGAARAHIVGSLGDSAVALVREGGFDPLPVAGTTGGLVTLSVVDSVGRWTTSHAKAGPAKPRVVRLSPAARRTDVPLNVRIVAVFSAPVDSATAVAGVQLLQDGTVVPTESRLSTDRLEVVLQPDAPLAANTIYEVTVAATVTDVFGTALGAPVSTSFTTGASSAGAPFMSISGYAHPWRNSWLNLYRLQEGDAVGLAMLQYENGPLSAFTEGVPTTWSSSDTTVLQVVEQAPGYAIEVGLRPGRARLRAEALGVVVERDIEVVPRLGSSPTGPVLARLNVQVNVTGTDPDTEFRLKDDYSGAYPDGCFEEDWYFTRCTSYHVLAPGRNRLEVVPGARQLVLGGIAAHCVATDGLTRELALPLQQAQDVTFTVTCGANASTLRVRPLVAGALLPYHLRVAYSNLNCHACEDTLLTSQTHEIRVAPGPQRVSVHTPDYCRVQGANPVQATVSEGAVLEVAFGVLCDRAGSVNVRVSVQGVNKDESFWIEGGLEAPEHDGFPRVDRQPLDPARSFALPAGRFYAFALSDVAPNCEVIGNNPATVLVQLGVTSSLNFNVRCE